MLIYSKTGFVAQEFEARHVRVGHRKMARTLISVNFIFVNQNILTFIWEIFHHSFFMLLQI